MGPRTGHRWTPSVPVLVAPKPIWIKPARQRLREAASSVQDTANSLPATESLACLTRVALVLIGDLHSLTVELFEASRSQGRHCEVEPLVNRVVANGLVHFARSAISISERAGGRGAGGVVEAISESIMECCEAMAVNAACVREFGIAGGPRMLLALYAESGATHGTQVG